MFEKAATELGYHPFPQPISNTSRPYTNIEGLTLGACQYCGHCDKSGCEANAKAGPQICILPLLRADVKFTLRSRSWVSRLIYDKAGSQGDGVIYIDTRTGEEYEQPAGSFVLSAYVFGNISLLFHSGIGEPYDPSTGKGAVGKNYCYQLSRMGVTMFFENKEFNPSSARPARQWLSTTADGDNFDHNGSRLPRWITLCMWPRRWPADRLPPRFRLAHPALGSAWKKATAKWYHHAGQHCGVRIQLRQSLQLSRPRPDLQGPARTAVLRLTLQFSWRTITRSWSTRSASRARSHAR